MNSTGGAIDFESYIKTDQFRQGVRIMNQDVRGLTNTVKTESDKMNDTFKQMGKLAAGAFAFTEIASLPGQITKVRGEFQQLEIAFTTMLKSKAASDKLMSEVVEFAGTTPFGLKDSAQATKQLLAYGSSASEVIKELRILGDVAAGVSAPIGDLTYLYGTLRTQGRAYAVDIRQFAGRGIPIYAELAKVLGVNVDKVNDLVEAGKVGFPQVEQAFQNMTATGGMFGGLMEAQSKSLTGLTAQFRDAVDVMFNDLGKSQEGFIAEIIKGGISLTENYQQVIDILKVVVAGYGAYRAALMATYVLQGQSLLLTEVRAFFQLAGSIKSAADAQALFNLVTKANPIGLAIGLIAALGTAYFVFGGKVSEAKQAQDRMNEAIAKSELEMSKEISKIEILRKQITDENRSRNEKTAKLKELVALNPEILNGITLENAATGRATELINQYVRAKKEQIRVSAIQAQIDENLGKVNDIKSGKLDSDYDVSTWTKAGLYAGAAESGETANVGAKIAKEMAARKDQAVKEIQDLNKALMDQIGNGIEQRRAGRRKEQDDQKQDIKKTSDYYDEQIKLLKEKKGKEATTRAEGAVFDRKIAALEAKKRAITGELSPEQKEAAKAAEKAAKAVKDENVKTFSEEIDEKKKMFELYNRWVANYGTEAADEQFKSLIAKNKSYVDYLDKEIERLSYVKDSGEMSYGDATDLDKLISQRTEATGGLSPIDQFKQSLSEAKEEALTLTDYLVELRSVQDKLRSQAPTKDVTDKLEIAAKDEIAVEKQRRKMLSEFLVSVEESEQRRMDIENNYAELRKILNDRSGEEKTDAYQRAMDIINRKEGEEHAERKRRIYEASEEYKALIRNVNEAANSNGLLGQINSQKDLVANIISKEGFSEGAIQEERKLREMQRLLYSQIAGAVGELGDALTEVNGDLGNIGRALSGIASQGNNLITVFDKNAKSSEKWAAAAQSASNLIGIVASSARQRKEAEADYYRSVLAYQSEYNLMINEQIRLQGEAGESVFVKDYAGRIKGAQDSLADAAIKYQEVLDKLENGKAKTGQRNGFDWKAVGAGAASGATIGGIAGAGVFSWATAAIGAVGGALVGLIGGLKKKDKYAPLLEEYKELVQVGADGVEYLNVEIAKILISTNRVDEETKGLLQNAIDLQEQMNTAKAAITEITTTLAGQLGDSLRENLVGAFIAGEDAGEAMFQSLNKSLAGFLEQMIFSAVFSKRMKKFQDEMDASLGEGGDGSVIDDYGRLFADLGGLNKQFEQMMTQAKAEAEKNGFDLWNPSDTTNRAKGLSGSMSAMSQDTGNLLAGQFNALRISNADIASSMRSMLIYQANISKNSEFQRFLPMLESIDDRIKALNSNTMRWWG